MAGLGSPMLVQMLKQHASKVLKPLWLKSGMLQQRQTGIESFSL